MNDDYLIPGKCLAVGMMGMRFFYMEDDFYAGQFTKRIVPKNFSFTQRVAIYFAGILNKFEPVFKNVLVRNFEIIFSSQKISLPTKEGLIDFDFIESFVAELEAAHLAELEAYLEASGLDDYILTPEEEAIVSNFDSLNWKEFSVEDIFEKISVKKVSKSDVQKNRSEIFATPVVYCKYGDNGIMYWAKNGVAEVRDNIISVVYNGAIAAGKVYAQKESTGILAESYFISHKQNPGNHEINLFLSAVLEKILYPKYSRDFLATWSGRVQKDILILPSGLDDVIDYESILILISAIKKIIIKDLVEYAQSKSVVTRQVIQNR